MTIQLVKFLLAQTLQKYHYCNSNTLWKPFFAPLFTYNVLLLFNLKCFFPFLCRDLSKPRCCHFNLLQPQQSDINKGNCPNFKVIPRATTPDILRTYEMLFLHWISWNIKISSWSVCHIAKYSHQSDIEIYQVVVSCINQWKCKNKEGPTMTLDVYYGHSKLLPANFLSMTGDGDWKQGFVFTTRYMLL